MSGLDGAKYNFNIDQQYTDGEKAYTDEEYAFWESQFSKK